jgi:hypothetical protein
MDKKLIDYLRSGKSWILVGSGPSSAMGYPSWYSLAKSAVDYAETKGHEISEVRQMIGKDNPDFPEIFEEISNIITMPVLLRELRDKMKPNPASSSEIYDIITAWPVPVYLTTNYDDELQAGLTRIGEPYLPYDNRAEHMALLSEELEGAIVKIHGDLRSERGLILTSSQYRAIETDESFLYWRERMKAIFQMKRLIVLGHSLTDSNIRQVLEIAKSASGVELPICWIADNVPMKEAEKFKHKYRVNVVSYSNTNNRHEGLLPLLKTVSRFVPPRSRIVLGNHSNANSSPSRASTTALHVYNRSAKGLDRVQVILAAIEGNYSRLKAIEPFTIEDALSEIGWTAGIEVDSKLKQELKAILLDKSYVNHMKDRFVTTAEGAVALSEKKSRFEHDKSRFIQALRMRINRSPISTSLKTDDLESLPKVIEQSLSYYFESAGLSFATMLNDAHKWELPVCVLEYIREASTQYSDYNVRQLFCSITLDMFCEPKLAEKEYIGRVAEGFLTFHALGVFGAVFDERIKQLGSTVWLLDSNILIHMVSKGYVAGFGVRSCVAWLKENMIQLYTTENLFEELMGHLKFAFRIIADHGENSVQMMAAATGEIPYNKSNAFLQGYLEVKAGGGTGGWENHCTSVFGSMSLSRESVKNLLLDLGIEVLRFSDWPGFSEIRDYGMQREYQCRIVETLNRLPVFNGGTTLRADILPRDPHEKAKPESEALTIINGERKGHLDVLSAGKSDAWFVSDTSILNAVFDEDKATWPSTAFEMHIATLMGNENAADITFGSVVETIARSGYSVISSDSLTRAFSQLIDEETLFIEKERELLSENLSDKYAELPDKVLARLSPEARPLAALQFKEEAFTEENRKRKIAEDRQKNAEDEAKIAKKELDKVSKYTLKQMSKREEKSKRNKRKNKSNSKRKKKK